MKKLIALAAIAVAASGCVMTRPTNAWAPITIDVQTPAAGFIDNSVQPLRKGTATASGILCYTEGDASLKAAMENGGITKIHHVDFKVKNIFGVVGSTTTIVYGE